MPKFNVQLTRDIQETAWIEVEADDMVGAEAAALAMAERLAPSEDGEETDPKIKWDRLQLDEAEAQKVTRWAIRALVEAARK